MTGGFGTKPEGVESGEKPNPDKSTGWNPSEEPGKLKKGIGCKSNEGPGKLRSGAGCKSSNGSENPKLVRT